RRAIRSAVGGLILEVGRLDDQRLAFPMAARVAHVGADALANVRARIDGNDAGLVNHLVANRDEAGALVDLIGAAVDRRHHRARQTTRDALIVDGPLLVRSGGPAS